MNIVTPLVPVAAAAIETVVHGVGDVLRSGDTFTRLLRGESTAAGKEGPAVAEGAPQPSGLGQHVQREAVRQRFETLRELVHQRLVERFAESGISLSEPVVLASSDGRLVEAGNHWDRPDIEHLLESDAGLRGGVAQLLEQGSLLLGSGPAGTGTGRIGRPRLVVSENEIFFQVV